MGVKQLAQGLAQRPGSGLSVLLSSQPPKLADKRIGHSHHQPACQGGVRMPRPLPKQSEVYLFHLQPP